MSALGFNVPPTTQSYGDGPQFKVSSKRPEKRGIDFVIPGLVVKRVIHYTTTTPNMGTKMKENLEMYSNSSMH